MSNEENVHRRSTATVVMPVTAAAAIAVFIFAYIQNRGEIIDACIIFNIHTFCNLKTDCPFLLLLSLQRIQISTLTHCTRVERGIKAAQNTIGCIVIISEKRLLKNPNSRVRLSSFKILAHGFHFWPI